MLNGSGWVMAMRFWSLVDRLAGKGSEVWRVHWRATELARAGRDIVFPRRPNALAAASRCRPVRLP
jgi:hypothetical protein